MQSFYEFEMEGSPATVISFIGHDDDHAWGELASIFESTFKQLDVDIKGAYKISQSL